jgi:CheY-like chemotaxis protein
MKHALIIEDRELIALMIESELAEFGYASADRATSQREAIRFANQRCPDLVTADDRLSYGSGIAAVRHICRHRAIPVVFITGDPEHIEQAIPGAVILEKPFTHSGLARAIRLAVDGARTHACLGRNDITGPSNQMSAFHPKQTLALRASLN